MESVPNGPIPLLGQQRARQQQALHQVVVNTYLSLVPVVASGVLAHADMYAEREEIPDRIADEAWAVARAAVRKIGIDVAERPENGDE